MIAKQRGMLADAGLIDECDRVMRTDEIVVCARREVEPTPPPPPPDRLLDIPAVHLGAPPPGKGVGVGVTMRGCFLQKCPYKVVLIDLASIPVAAPGSDADLMARGEMRDR